MIIYLLLFTNLNIFFNSFYFIPIGIGNVTSNPKNHVPVPQIMFLFLKSCSCSPNHVPVPQIMFLFSKIMFPFLKIMFLFPKSCSCSSRILFQMILFRIILRLNNAPTFHLHIHQFCISLKVHFAIYKVHQTFPVDLSLTGIGSNGIVCCIFLKKYDPSFWLFYD